MSALDSTAQNTPARRRLRLPAAAAFFGSSLGFFGLYIAAGAPSPLFPVLEQDWRFPAWTLTVAFAAYAVALVVALVFVGGLSDLIGRRPVIVVSLAVEVVAMLLFVFAPNIGWIIAARVVQGLATGAATSAYSAALLELAPERYRKLGTLFGSLAPAGGLALGILAGGLAAQLSTTPVPLLFSLIAAVMVLAGLVALLSAETVTRRPGALASLAPRVRMPRPARVEFAAAVPLLISAWMLAGLALGLIPSLMRARFLLDGGLIVGVTSALEPAAAAVVGLVLGVRLTARRTSEFGGAAVLVGSALILVSFALAQYPVLAVGSVIGGAGFGAVFSGALRSIAPRVRPEERAEAFSAVYLVSYLSFGVPSIIAGQLIAPLGLLPVSLGYVVVILVFAVTGIVAQLRLARADASPDSGAAVAS
jgi:MFS family permease